MYIISSAMEGGTSTSKCQASPLFEDDSPEEVKQKKPFFHIEKPTALL
jgi:hypothetical protein